MIESLNYNIHDILEIQLNRTKKFDLMRGLDIELLPFRVHDVKNPDIIFNVGKFIPSNNNCDVVDHKYFVKDNYFYCKDFSGKVNWEVEIFGFEEGQTVVNYNYNTSGFNTLISHFSVETFLLRPMIYKKLSDKGFFMIHSAGIHKFDKAYLLAGRGGAFKTSLVMDFVKKGKFNYLGDDWVILHDKFVHSFPAHLSLFDYIYSHKENEHINILDKMGFVKSLWMGEDTIKNVPIAKSGELKAIFFIGKINKNEGVSVKNMNRENAIIKLIESNKMEMNSLSDSLVGFSLSPFYKYMLAYSYVFINSGISRHWDNLRNNFEKILKDIPIFEIEVPNKYNSNIYENVLSLIEEIK